MDLNLFHISILVFSCILIQFIFKWTVGSKISKIDDMLNQSRKDYHMLRRLQHMSTGLLILYIWTSSPRLYCQVGLAIGIAGFLIMSWYRKINPKFNESYIKSFGFLLRPHEINNLPGAVYFMVGLLFSFSFYGRIEVYMSIVILSFGDPFASLCGIYFKSPKISKDKSVAGTLGCGVVCAVIGMMFYFFNSEFSHVREEIQPFEFASAILVVGLLSEIGPSSRTIHFEDNISIPVYAGLLFTGYLKYIHPLSIQI